MEASRQDSAAPRGDFSHGGDRADGCLHFERPPRAPAGKNALSYAAAASVTSTPPIRVQDAPKVLSSAATRLRVHKQSR